MSAVDYSNPIYSGSVPFGPLNPFSVDPITHQILGVPTTPGKFFYALDVEVYDAGILLASTQIVSTVIIYDCLRLVKAELDAEIADGRYRLETCVGAPLPVVNVSGEVERIDSLEWRIEGAYHGDEWTPTFRFDAPGTYDGQLVLNPGRTCTDTADFRITVHPNPTAAFNAAYDPCVAGPVAHYDRSDGGTAPYRYDWRLGQGLRDSVADPLAHYTVPGPFTTTLVLTDAHGCADTLARAVDYRPAPAVLVVAPTARRGCPPFTTTFDNRSVPVDSTYRLRWDFGDGQSDTTSSPTHTYTGLGSYDVGLRIESPLGCLIDTVFRELVRVDAWPSAAFTIDPTTPEGLGTRITATATDPDLPRYEWWLAETVAGEGAELIHQPADTGQLALTLVVTNAAYCQDTLTRRVRVAPVAAFHLPNAFTPDHDGRNDTFRGRGVTDYLSDFELAVYDRAGNRLFHTTDPTKGWNGTHHGRPLPQGAYVWRLHYRVLGGDLRPRTGSVLLLRN